MDREEVARLEEQRQDLTNELVALQNRAGSLGLYRTMHAIKEACRVVGWERAARLTRKRATAWFVELAQDLPNGLEEQEGAVEQTAAVFSNFEVLREPGSGLAVEQTGSIVVALLEEDWRDMGEPEVVTVTVEPGDKLNVGGG